MTAARVFDVDEAIFAEIAFRLITPVDRHDASVIALQQLKIQTGIILNVINIAVAAMGLALGLAFGLGCKDIAGKAAANFFESLTKK